MITIRDFSGCYRGMSLWMRHGPTTTRESRRSSEWNPVDLSKRSWPMCFGTPQGFLLIDYVGKFRTITGEFCSNLVKMDETCVLHWFIKVVSSLFSRCRIRNVRVELVRWADVTRSCRPSYCGSPPCTTMCCRRSALVPRPDSASDGRLRPLGWSKSTKEDCLIGTLCVDMYRTDTAF